MEQCDITLGWSVTIETHSDVNTHYSPLSTSALGGSQSTQCKTLNGCWPLPSAGGVEGVEGVERTLDRVVNVILVSVRPISPDFVLTNVNLQPPSQPHFA